MATTLPALRAAMGGLDYYVAVSTVGEATRTVRYVEEVDDWSPETPPELKLQRKLNSQRVEREMVPYLLENADHFYSALTVEVRAPTDADAPTVLFEAQRRFPGGIEFGVVTLDGSETLYALDGQHRLRSLELALRQQPQLAREQIALILIPFRGISRSQSLFSDLNRYARPPSKSMSLLFTHRESLARIAKRVAALAQLLDGRVNMESTTLSSNAKQFITLSTLYEASRAWVRPRAPASQFDEDQMVEELVALWEMLTEAIPQWRLVADEAEHPAYLRARFLNMHGVCQQAIFATVARARDQLSKASTSLPAPWMRSVAEGLRRIDWRLANPRFQGIALHGGRVNNTSTSIRNLTGLLSWDLGLEPAAAEREVIQRTFEQQGLPFVPIPGARPRRRSSQGKNRVPASN